MAKNKVPLSSLSDAIKSLRQKKFLPIYLFSGEDEFGIEEALKIADETISPFIGSDFDKEVLYGDEQNANTIINNASAFPFASEKKLIIVKEFDKLKDKKQLSPYINSPADFSILILIQNGAIENFNTEPYKSLLQNKFIFDAKELKGKYLIEWLINTVNSNGKDITIENAQNLIDIVGENRDLVAAQLEKILNYIGNNKEITFESVKSMSSLLKEYSIFDLQNAIGKKNKKEALKVGFNLLEKATESNKIILIIAMLTKYFTQIMRVKELAEINTTVEEGARIIGTHFFYYPDYIKASNLYREKGIYRAAQALLKADLAVKTTSLDDKTILTTLIAEILLN